MKSPILSGAMALTLSLGALSVVYAGSATWNSNPTSGDWTNAANWTPATVPDGPDAVATFSLSNQTSVSIAAEEIVVKGIVFQPDASAFTFTMGPLPGASLVFGDDGIMNNSARVQNFINPAACDGRRPGFIHFVGNAFADSQILFTNEGGRSDLASGLIIFSAHSTAGEATFVNEPACDSSSIYGAGVNFYNYSSAGSAIFINEGGAVSGGGGGTITFDASATAGNAQITVRGGSVPGAVNSFVYFVGHATAGSATFVAEGSQAEGAYGGQIIFLGSASAENANFIVNGGILGSAFGGILDFAFVSRMDNATCVINGGTNGGPGGILELSGHSTGGTARIELFGNGSLNLSEHDAPGITIGSIEGDGMVFLGANNLTTGTNNLSTTFSGVIEDGDFSGGIVGSLTKVGTGTLTLSGTNTYTGGTTLSGGVLVINNATGYGTGTGAVNVNAGTLGGKGTIAGAVTVGTGSGSGAFLEPSVGVVKTTSLTIQSALNFKADSTYTYKLNIRRVKADKVIANGVTIDSGAQFNFVAGANETLTLGKKFVAISNTAATPISGTFANLPDGSTFTVGPNTFQVSYSGGDGNDLTLTVVP